MVVFNVGNISRPNFFFHFLNYLVLYWYSRFFIVVLHVLLLLSVRNSKNRQWCSIIRPTKITDLPRADSGWTNRICGPVATLLHRLFFTSWQRLIWIPCSLHPQPFTGNKDMIFVIDYACRYTLTYNSVYMLLHSFPPVIGVGWPLSKRWPNDRHSFILHIDVRHLICFCVISKDVLRNRVPIL